MFGFITDFKHQRTIVEALGFYVFYVAVGVVAGALLGYVAGLFDPSFGFDEGLRIGNGVSIVLSLGLALALARAKRLLGHAGYIVVILLAGVGGAVGGVLLGVIFAAFLSTRGVSHDAASPQEQAAA